MRAPSRPPAHKIGLTDRSVFAPDVEDHDSSHEDCHNVDEGGRCGYKIGRAMISINTIQNAMMSDTGA